MNKKIFTVFAIIIGSVALVAAGFFIAYKIANQKDLADYLPPQTVGYLELAPNDVSLLNYSAANFRGKIQLQKLMEKIGLWGGINQTIASDRIEKIGLAIIKKDDDSWQKVWLIKTKNGSPDAFLPKGVFSAPISKNIFVFSADTVVVDNFKQTMDSTAKRMIKSKFSRQKFFNTYLAEDFLAVATDPLPTPPLARGRAYDAEINLLRQFSLSIDSPLILSLKSDGQTIFLNANFTDGFENNLRALSASDYDLIKKMPLKNFVMAMEIASFKEMLKVLENKMTAQLGAEKVAEQKKMWSEKYGFKWEDFDKFFDWPAVFWFDANNLKQNNKAVLANWPDGLVLKVKNDNKVAEVYQRIKNILSAVVAFEQPSAENIKLPDKSEIKILIADPARVNWQTEAEIEFLVADNILVSLARRGNLIYLAKNRTVLRQILSNQEDNAKIKVCPDYVGEEAIYLNGREFSGSLIFLLDEIFIVAERSGKEVNLKGCILW
ncbi:MAG: hypothetical protein PHT40_04195 [Patescibacteria group bacterium]|nr:hypothetical protein [Patescibacteria group bacterium]